MSIPHAPPPETSESAIPHGTATLRVSCAGAGAPLIVRVRRFIKVARRDYGLNAVALDLPEDDRKGGAA